MGEICLRRAAPEDCRLLYAWRNDPLVRKNSFHTGVIPYEDHARWFEGMMKNPDRLQYILLADGEPAGQIRLDVQGQEAEISYSIDGAHRGRGLGNRIVRLAGARAAKDLPKGVGLLTAKVLPQNTASHRVFLANDFHKREENASFTEYVKEIRRPA